MPSASMAVARGPVREFAFATPSGNVVSSVALRGRVTAVLFVTTFDLGSQVMARRLNESVSHHRPRINALAVVLEPAHNAVLADVFRQSLGLRYEVAVAGQATFDEEGPLGAIRSVPTLVVLDRNGREVLRKQGSISGPVLEQGLLRAEQ